jgi:NADH-ubiquinone oxidoreductase chain 5
LFSGYLVRDLFVGLGSIFFGNSIFILPKNFNLIEAEFLPLQIKLLPLIFSLSGMFLALFLNI